MKDFTIFIYKEDTTVFHEQLRKKSYLCQVYCLLSVDSMHTMSETKPKRQEVQLSAPAPVMHKP